jgi:hypothetical protein
MSLFHRVQFKKPDPLDDGTAEEIVREKSEAAIDLMSDGTQGLVDFWDQVHKDLKKDS